jgi:hypothetical protein
MRIISFPRRCVCLALVLITSFHLGCSGGAGDDTAELAPSGGTVVLDGEPVANAAVTLTPAAKAGNGAVGVTDEFGVFKLTNVRGRDGAEAGTYTVTISKFAMPDGSPFPPDADSGDFAAMGVEHIPPKYSDPQQSKLTVDIPPGGKNDLYFELTTE